MNGDKFENESFNLEYKREISKSDKTWLKSIVSFSNTSGGELIVGIEDKTLTVVGIKEDRSTIEQRIIESISNNIQPKPMIDISFKNYDNNEIVVIYVAKGQNTPYYLKSDGVENGCYVRFGSTDRLATESERQELVLSRKSSYFSSEVYEADNERVCLKDDEIIDFVDLINSKIKTKKIIDDAKLIEWKLVKNMNKNLYATNGYMLLTRNPFSNGVIRIGVFEGNTKSKLKAEYLIEGSIVNQFDESLNLILRLLEDGFVFESRREIKYRLPATSIREILANAIVHRNYIENHPIRISIFNDRLEIFSPGSFYDGIQLEDALNGISKLRNPNIAEVFYHLGIIEKWGSGIIRANEEMVNNHYQKVQFSVSNHGINAVLSMVKEVQLKDSFLSLENYLDSKDSFTRKDIEFDLEITEHQARYYIEKWLHENKIDRVGQTRKSRYVVKK